jgi:hypothetical protein
MCITEEFLDSTFLQLFSKLMAATKSFKTSVSMLRNISDRYYEQDEKVSFGSEDSARIWLKLAAEKELKLQTT